MFALPLAALLALVLLTVLAAAGRLRFLADEMPTRGRRLAALLLVWAVLVVCVFYPTLSPGDAADVDPQTLSFASIFTGQVILTGFLLLWWVLARPVPLLRFLRLEYPSADDVRFGLWVGAGGWLCAIAASAVVALVLLAVGYNPLGGQDTLAQPLEVPPLLLWLSDLPVWRKLVVVGVAMTVEEGFYRAFLQTRVGWLLSSVLFALSHGGYGLPTLTASVFVVSLAIGWALRRRGNLVPCVVAHGVFDAVQLLVVMPIAVARLRALA
jgi:membrane protease YdiL (CAAX protease family)